MVEDPSGEKGMRKAVKEPIKFCPRCGRKLELDMASATTGTISYDEETDSVKEEVTGKAHALLSYCKDCDMSYQVVNAEDKHYQILAFRGVPSHD